jgi:hypothetical protein
MDGRDAAKIQCPRAQQDRHYVIVAGIAINNDSWLHMLVQIFIC